MESYLELEDIESYEYIDLETVYDIEVENSHCYYLDCDKPILVHNSSKTWSIFQILLARAIAGKKETYTIGRQKLTWLKATMLKDFKELTDMYGIKVTPRISERRADQVYDINGTEFAFFGLDYPEKVHGRKQHIFWLNEVMEIEKSHFDQLEQRTELFSILDYNPYDDQHWVYSLHKREDVKVIESTLLDNLDNISETIKNKLFGYEPTEENYKRGTADPYMYSVYVRGMAAALRGVIFDNWDIVDTVPSGAKLLGYGLDFGFTNDPTALIAIYQHNEKDLYLDELIFETGLLVVSPQEGVKTLSKRMKALDVGYDQIVADSAQPESIQALRYEGFNIKGANKASVGRKGSIEFGIDTMKGYKLHATRRSINLQSELRKYKWLEDKNGNSTRTPIDDFNHTIDASRYLIREKLGTKFETKLYPASVLG